MKRILEVIAGMVAAGTLAGCSADHADRYEDGYLTEEEREAQEIIEEQVAYYRKYFVEAFHGEHLIADVEISWCEDITFTPFETPTEVTGITDITADGKAKICSYILSDDPEYAMDAVICSCYYVIDYIYIDPDFQVGIDPLIIYFYQYDSETGLIMDSGKECHGDIIDDEKFFLSNFYQFGSLPTYLTYTPLN